MVLIIVGHARPSDYDDLSPEKLSYGLKSTDQDDYLNPSDEHNEPNEYHSTEIFTKYPDNQEVNESKEAKRSERKDKYQEISLRSFISSIESDLVSKARDINANVRLRRSLSEKTVDEATSSENNTSIDAYKNLFGGLFEYTRAERHSSEESEKDIKIPLNGLVQAVETTLINSAQNLKNPETLELAKCDKTSNDSSPSNLHLDEPLKDINSTEKIQVKKLTSLNVHDLNILKPIAFNAVASVDPPSTTDPISYNDELITTTENSTNQQTNYSLVHSSNTVHLLPGAYRKLAHIQHQQIQQSVFNSNLAIFPMIPPQSINIPNLIQTTIQENVDDTTVTVHPITPIPEKTVSVDLEKLKEKIAEIQADPVILSQI